jgi:hypothetical protein
MYPRIPWEKVVDPLGSAEHTFGTTGLKKQEEHLEVDHNVEKAGSFNVWEQVEEDED